MRRFLTIILCVTLYLMWGVSDGTLSHRRGQAQSSTEASSTVATASSDEGYRFSQQRTTLSQYVATSTISQSRSNATNFTPTTKAQSPTSRASARQKAECNKILSAAIHSRRAGHLTEIFEYNHFRSSLRVVYYLHTLCRLRI